MLSLSFFFFCNCPLLWYFRRNGRLQHICFINCVGIHYSPKTQILTSVMYLYLYLTIFMQLSLSRSLCTNIDWKIFGTKIRILKQAQLFFFKSHFDSQRIPATCRKLHLTAHAHISRAFANTSHYLQSSFILKSIFVIGGLRGPITPQQFSKEDCACQQRSFLRRSKEPKRLLSIRRRIFSKEIVPECFKKT